MDEIDITTLKYVMYVRKSTEDKGRQIRSIQDQISDCIELQTRLGLNIVKVIREEKSAKKPNQRPEFNQMVKDIRNGKYDGILAWNPDRLSRNMKEGGELIDMIDEGLIVDLKFVTHHFTNDANGKMLLGMAFVLSKQYSDDLSQKVTRGVRNRFGEGKTPIPKYGYKNIDGFYHPDNQNHELIIQAWEAKIRGVSHKDIANDMNSAGFYREIKKDKRRIYMTPQKLTEMFRDPFYYGVLMQAKQSVDLREIYDFKPAVLEEDYFKIQRQAGRKIGIYKTKRAVIYPFKGLLKCAYCGSTMYIGASTSGTKKDKFLYCRCDNNDCLRVKNKLKKSIRIKYVLEFIYNILHEGLPFTEKDYNMYYDGLKSISEKKRMILKRDLHNSEGSLKSLKPQINELALKLLNPNINKTSQSVGENRLSEMEDQKREYEEKILKLKQALDKSEDYSLTLEQFLNLSKNAGNAIKFAEAQIKDTITKFIFLNLTIGIDEVLEYQLKEPFNTLFKHHKILNGRGERT